MFGTSTAKVKLLSIVTALALATSSCGAAMAPAAFAGDADDASVLEELGELEDAPFTEDEDADDELAGAEETEAEGDADSTEADGAADALDSEGDTPLPDEAADATLDGLTAALASEPVALADYPDGINWEPVENGVGEVGTCVWGIDAATKTLYIRPPDGAETGTLPSIYEVANDDKPATPWQKSGAKKAVILPGVIAGDRCSLFYSSLSLTEVEGLENLDIKNTTTLAGMFLYCFALKEVKLPDWNAPNLVDMQYMFAMNNKLTEIKFGNMYAPKLESLEATFWGCEILETVDLSGLYAPNITNMVSTFSQDWKLVSIIWPEHLDTSKVLYMLATFEECKSLDYLDLSGFDTSSVLTMEDMFRDSTIAWLNISSFDMSNVIDTHYMFFGANIKKVSVGPHTPVDMLNSKPHWYMLEGEPCDNGRIPDGTTGVYVIVEKILMSEATKYLPEGSSPFTLTATIVPDSVKLPVSWRSSNEKVATVDQNGRVTMHAAGSANIYADCLGVTGKCALSVVSVKVAEAQTIGINAAPLKVKATFTPTTITSKQDVNVNWTSSNTSVVSMSYSKATATVTPKKAGTTTLTVECVGASATCDVTVVAMSMDQSSKTAYVGEDPFQLTANIDPGTVDATVLWKSSNTAVATVDENGRVTPVKKGSATITATLAGIDGVSATCAVTVQNAVVTMAETEKTVSVNTEPFTLDATVEPDTVTQPLAWSSSDESVATVDSDGKVTVHKPGPATITASCADAKDSCLLTVASLTLSEQARTVGVDASPFKLTATVEPSSAGIVTWASSNTDVATVDSDGNVTVKGAGHAIITAELDGIEGAQATCELTVASVTLSETAKTVSVDSDPFTLTATIAPDALKNNAIIWTSSDTDVAMVDSNGEVTVYKEGTAEITAAASGISAAQATCALTVASVSLSEPAKTIGANAKPFTLTATVEPRTVTEPVVWTSSDPAVAIVDAKGVVTLKGPGTAEISAACCGAKAVCDLTVISMDLGETSRAVREDSEPFTITADVIPSSCADQVVWSSSDMSVANVDAGGLEVPGIGKSACTVIVQGVGTTVITAEAYGVTYSCVLAVYAAPVVKLSEISKTVREDARTFTLTATVEPSALADQVSWESSDPSVVSIVTVAASLSAAPAAVLEAALSDGMAIARAAGDGSGLATTFAAGDSVCTVAVHSVGTADITATVEGVSSVCALTVEKAPEPPVEPEDPDGPSNTGGSTGSGGGQSGSGQGGSQTPGSSNGSSLLDILTEKTPLVQTGDDAGLLIVAASMALSTAAILLLVSRRCFMPQGRHARQTAK